MVSWLVDLLCSVALELHGRKLLTVRHLSPETLLRILEPRSYCKVNLIPPPNAPVTRVRCQGQHLPWHPTQPAYRRKDVEPSRILRAPVSVSFLLYLVFYIILKRSIKSYPNTTKLFNIYN